MKKGIIKLILAVVVVFLLVQSLTSRNTTTTARISLIMPFFIPDGLLMM